MASRMSSSGAVSASRSSTLESSNRRGKPVVASTPRTSVESSLSSGAGATDVDAQLLGRGQADPQIVSAAQVILKGLVHPIAADAHRRRRDDVPQAQHRDFGRTAANVADHARHGLGDRQACADGGRDRFADQEHLPGRPRDGHCCRRPAFRRV